MLRIDRLSLHVRAAAAPERAERLARRLRDAAVAGIERGGYALPSGAGHLFVERVALQCSVASEWDDAAIGAEVARALAAALQASVERPGTMAFRDRVELLAAFYSALAEGRAWEQWWLEEFDGLKPLPASAALRTSVMNEREQGVAALARLTEASLSRVLGVLAPGDAARLLQWLSACSASAVPAAAVLWKASAALAHAPDDAVALLRAVIGLERAQPGAAGAKALDWLRQMAALRAAAARGERSPPASREARGDWFDELGESEAQYIREELAAPAAAAPSSAQEAGRAKQRTAHERLFTPRGGAFVLLKALDWLGWPAAWASATGNEELARALAWAVALRALEPRGAAGLRDSVLHEALALERPLALLRGRRREVKAVLEKKLSATANALLEEFSRRIPGLAGASRGYLRANALSLPASVERNGDACVVRLGRAPLDVLLVLAGAKSGRIALPGAAAIELRAEAAG